MTAKGGRVATAALLPLLIATAAQAHRAPNPGHLRLDARAAYQRAVIRHDRTVLRWFQNHPARTRSLSSLDRLQVASRRNRVVRYHKHQLRWVTRELGETLRAIRLRDERAEAAEARREAARAWDEADADWLTAVALADRVYPGTYGWLKSCSAEWSEGGWGGFVMNHQGSGAGGWLQFMSGTFYSYVDAAFAEARRRGFAVPAEYRAWTSRVGQALTGAFMYVNGGRGHWSGSGC